MSDGWQPYLKKGETLLWEGRPDTKLFLLDRQEKYKHMLALTWLAFMIVYFNVSPGGLMGFLSSAWFAAPILLVLVLLVFAYFLVGRWVLDQYQRQHTVYAISNQRAFIARSDFGKKDLKSMPITPDMAVKFKNEPLGSIVFGPKPNIFRRNNKWTVEDGSFTFRGLEDARSVLQVVADVQEAMEQEGQANKSL